MFVVGIQMTRAQILGMLVIVAKDIANATDRGVVDIHGRLDTRIIILIQDRQYLHHGKHNFAQTADLAAEDQKAFQAFEAQGIAIVDETVTAKLTHDRFVDGGILGQAARAVLTHEKP